MQKICREDQPFVQEDLPFEQAIARLTEMGEPHKVEYRKELHDKGIRYDRVLHERPVRGHVRRAAWRTPRTCVRTVSSSHSLAAHTGVATKRADDAYLRLCL